MKRLHLLIVIFLSSLAILFFASAQPALNIARQGTNVLVSWAATNSAKVILQQKNVLTLSSNWLNASQSPLSNTGMFYVVVTPTNSASFFRLFLAASKIVDEPDDAFIDGRAAEGGSHRRYFTGDQRAACLKRGGSKFLGPVG
ncbi:MAG: hypothetical protein M3Y82_03665 [Verrucomicrobiota bacterium]|nr:hypothetical protein [Verrucomicrobiota bacterium]